MYIDSNGDISVLSEKSGSGYYTKEDYAANTNNRLKMFVKAYFVWGYGDVSVSDATGWYEGLEPGATTTISNEKVTTGTGRFAGLFNKYAYAEYYFLTTNRFGAAQQNRVKITVSESGNIS